MDQVKKNYINFLDSRFGAGRYNRYKTILYVKPDSLVMRLFKSIYPDLKSKRSLRVLDVGGGDGKRLRLLIDLFRRQGVEISAT